MILIMTMKVVIMIRKYDKNSDNIDYNDHN